MVRQGHLIKTRVLIAAVGAVLVGSLVLVVGCSGVRSEAPKEEQGQTEATKRQRGSTEADEEQGRAPGATASEEDTRCDKTRTFHRKGYLGSYVTNDVPGCPKGGLLLGTDKPDNLAGKEGDDEIRGLGDQDALYGGQGDDLMVGGPDHVEGGRYKGNDVLWGGPGSDVLHGGAGDDFLYAYSQQTKGCCGNDVMHGGDGKDTVVADEADGRRDELYCGEGRDRYMADETDFVSSSCEKVWNGIVN